MTRSVHLLDDHREMTSRWGGSYIGVKQEDGIKPFYVIEFQRKEVIGHFNDTGSNIQNISFDELSFDRPAMGHINFDDTVVQLQGLPRRQWKRGYRSQNNEIVHPFHPEEMYIGKNINWKGYDFVKEVFNPQYPTVSQCIEDVRELRCLARAFNSKFAIGIKSGFIHPRVFYKGINVGRLNQDNSVNLRRQAVHLFEELSQYLPCNKG